MRKKDAIDQMATVATGTVGKHLTYNLRQADRPERMTKDPLCS